MSNEKKQATVINAFVNTVTEDGNVLMRVRGNKEAPTVRVPLSNFKSEPVQHAGVAFALTDESNPRLSADHQYMKLDEVTLIEVTDEPVGAPSGSAITADEALSIIG